ncbi:MAG: hypothetical protein GY870_14965 [archaeon]|nr:hypothetical protein [archaeon]
MKLKKLELNKRTVQNLDTKELQEIKGGLPYTHPDVCCSSHYIRCERTLDCY